MYIYIYISLYLLDPVSWRCWCLLFGNSLFIDGLEMWL